MFNLSVFEKEQYYMKKALGLAEQAFEEEEVPIGCVIVHDNRIIAKSYNQTEKLKDVTAHAEMIAITQAENYRGSKWLRGCSVYVTIEPCLMCSYALTLSRVEKVVIGCEEKRTGGFGSVLDVNRYSLNPDVKVRRGVLRDKCKELMQRFFKVKRRKEKWNGL